MRFHYLPKQSLKKLDHTYKSIFCTLITMNQENYITVENWQHYIRSSTIQQIGIGTMFYRIVEILFIASQISAIKCSSGALHTR